MNSDLEKAFDDAMLLLAQNIRQGMLADDAMKFTQSISNLSIARERLQEKPPPQPMAMESETVTPKGE